MRNGGPRADKNVILPFQINEKTLEDDAGALHRHFAASVLLTFGDLLGHFFTSKLLFTDLYRQVGGRRFGALHIKGPRYARENGPARRQSVSEVGSFVTGPPQQFIFCPIFLLGNIPPPWAPSPFCFFSCFVVLDPVTTRARKRARSHTH